MLQREVAITERLLATGRRSSASLMTEPVTCVFTAYLFYHQVGTGEAFWVAKEIERGKWGPVYQIRNYRCLLGVGIRICIHGLKQNFKISNHHKIILLFLKVFQTLPGSYVFHSNSFDGKILEFQNNFILIPGIVKKQHGSGFVAGSGFNEYRSETLVKTDSSVGTTWI